MALTKPLYFKAIEGCYNSNNILFEELSELLLSWAADLLEDNYLDALTNGYAKFVNDVNRSQIKYEKRRRYENKSYSEVYRQVYNNPTYMSLYHWGVFTITFAWEHHLKIYKYFIEDFAGCLGKNRGKALDLGSGSGVWSLLLLSHKPNWLVEGIDISTYSVNMANNLARAAKLSERSKFIVDNALTHSLPQKADAVISCFLLEHLEDPQNLFLNASNNLIDGGYAFVTAALTAAEIDHIYEFRKESTLVNMAEDYGFRVISFRSESPKNHPRENYFLPRSMALILQKKVNDIW